MPADRFFHPRLGHSQKVCRLTDFEFRVWVQYQLSADDFGVMRASAVTLQADNDALAAKKPAVVQRALDFLVIVGLIFPFEHQGRRYVYQRDWQDWQHVGYPRATILPLPPDFEIEQCSPKTRELFARHSGKVSEKVSESLPPSRAREMAKANGLRLTANGGDEEINQRAGRLREELYPAWYAQHRHGARLRIVANNLEFQDAVSLCNTWSDEELETLARIVLTTDDEFISKTDRSFKIFAMKATWAHDRLKQVERAS